MATTGQQRLTRADIERKGWKYVGYRGFSRFLTTDNDFLLLRRFSTLHLRTLLALQDELTVLESKIEQVDLAASSKAYADCHNGSFRGEHSQERTVLLLQLREKLLQYGTLNVLTAPAISLFVDTLATDRNNHADKILIRFQKLQSMPLAPSRNSTSVQNWLFNNGDPIAQDEVTFLEQKYDLIPIVPKLKSYLRIVLEKSELFRFSSFWRVKRPNDQEDRFSDNEQVFLSSDDRIERCASVIILILGISMLIAPLWILNVTESATKKLGIITIFIVFFIGLISFTTVARPFESLRRSGVSIKIVDEA